VVGYAELAKMNSFTMDDVCNLVENKKTASSLVLRLIKKGLVKKIKNNLYSCVNVADGQLVASKYHIACSINNTAYISHHSAYEYMGLSNQVFYEIYVSSKKRFTSFDFEGITYKFVPSKMQYGIISPKNTHGIRVTTLERTIVDSIKDFEKIGGLEELLNCINAVLYLDEKEITKYLDLYKLQFLYQKTGFLLQHYKDKFQISPAFITYCKSKVGKSSRYFSKDSTRYIGEWKLVVPDDLFQILEQGGILTV
jgi:predicted transcriptional regulator of viral defense system